MKKLVLSLSFLLFMIHHVSGAETSGKNAPSSTAASEESIVNTYQYPRIVPKSEHFKVFANGKQVEVYYTSAGEFAAFSCRGVVDMEVHLPDQTIERVYLSPLKHGIEPVRKDDQISFQIPGPMLFAVMIGEHPALFIYANPLAENKPDPEDPDVLYFREGQVYETGDMILSSGQTLYIEGGAVVRGSVFASGAENVKIAGFGVLDGGYYKGVTSRNHVVFEDCKNSSIEGIVMIEPTAWMVVLGISDHIIIDNIKQISVLSTHDGIDIVGSQNVTIKNSIMKNGDDCVALKAFDRRNDRRRIRYDHSRDVKDILVEGCVMVTYAGGHIFEVGHELITDSVTRVVFRDVDVLGVHGHGGVFGINNSDRALVSDILYENIRVEHYYNKLVNLRVIKSRFHKGEERGQVRNVVFRDIEVTNSRYNPGYSVSLIGGYNENHTVEDVVFQNFRVNGEKVTHPDQIYLFTRNASNIVFR